ncbi:T9SS type A sorting domain-containing protein [bacterium]|nr:T9SS type A sorting domain-containing protein [bacterium]
MFKRLIFALLLSAVVFSAQAEKTVPVMVDRPSVMYWDDWLDGSWDLESRWVHTYQNGLLTRVVEQLFIDTDNWLNNYKYEVTYNGQGNQTLWQDTFWDNSDDAWRFNMKNETEYDGQGKASMTTYLHDQTSYLAFSKITYEYDGQNRCVREISYTWNDPDWTLFSQTDHTYNANGQIEQTVNSSISYFTNELEASTRTSHTYNSHGDRTTATSEVWMSISWANTSKQTWTYDGNNVLTNHLTQQWLYETWTNFKQMDNTVVDSKITQTVAQDWTDGAWANDTRMRFEYGSTAVEDVAIQPEVFQLSNYPNPFNPQTTIQFDLPVVSTASLEIFDVSGRKIRTLLPGSLYSSGTHKKVWDGCNESGETVPSGIYIYRLNCDGVSVTKRCLLLK